MFFSLFFHPLTRQPESLVFFSEEIELNSNQSVKTGSLHPSSPAATPDKSVFACGYAGQVRFRLRLRRTSPFSPAATPDKSVFACGYAGQVRFRLRLRRTSPFSQGASTFLIIESRV